MVEHQFGKYTVLTRLGAGGMAEVFLCKLQGIGGFEKHVVVKRIRPDIATDAEFIAMFLDEARVAANLNHPNIIQTFEVDQLHGVPYIAMEYVKGATLSGLLARHRDERKKINFGHVAWIFAGVCAGLDYAHGARDAAGRRLEIIHRDISPQNIIVSLDGTPKIFDFGVAKARGSLALTSANHVKGKFAYMAPEQIKAEPLDAKADVYAVGVCLYETTTGRRPFQGATEAEVYAARHLGTFKPPSAWMPTFPLELEDIILDAMNPDPVQRPTALELHDRLAALCAREGFASSASAVGAWMRDMFSDDSSAYGIYQSSPVLTPLPASSSAPVFNAIDRSSMGFPAPQARRGSWPLRVMSLVALLSVSAVGYRMLDKANAPESASAIGEREARQGDREIAAYLVEAEQNVATGHHTLAAELVAKAAAIPTRDAQLDIKRARLDHLVKVEQARAKAHEAMADSDWRSAIKLGSQLLADDPDDRDARELVDHARRQLDDTQVVDHARRQLDDTQVVDAKPAVSVPVAVAKSEKPAIATRPIERTIERKPIKASKPAAKPPAVAAVRTSIAAPVGSGSNAGSAALATAAATPPKANAATGSAMGSGSTATAITTTTVITTTTAAPAAGPPARPAITVTAPAAPPAIMNPGSLDAVPSIAKFAVDGSLTTSEVQSALARTLDTLRGCYRSAASQSKKTPDLSVRLTFEIDEGARATHVRVTGDTLGLASCMSAAVGGVRTRVAPDVGTVSVTATIRFKPTRQ